MIAVLLVLAFFSISLFIPTPPKTEALYVDFWLLIEIICDECRGQWSLCCHSICYDKFVRNSHTDQSNETLEAYDACMDTCPTDLARGCSF